MYDIIIVFLYGFCIDIAFVMWMYAAHIERYILVFVTSVLIAAPGVYGLIAIVADETLALPYLLGLGCGSVAGVFLKKRLKKYLDP